MTALPVRRAGRGAEGQVTASSRSSRCRLASLPHFRHRQGRCGQCCGSSRPPSSPLRRGSRRGSRRGGAAVTEAVAERPVDLMSDPAPPPFGRAHRRHPRRWSARPHARPRRRPPGLKSVVFAPTPTAPPDVAADRVIAAYDDEVSGRLLPRPSTSSPTNSRTWPPPPLSTLACRCVPAPARSRCRRSPVGEDLHRTRHLYRPVPRSHVSDDLKTAIGEIGFPPSSRLRRFGYMVRVRSRSPIPDDLEHAFEAMKGAPRSSRVKVPFRREISAVLTARGVDGTSITFSTPENEHSRTSFRSSRGCRPICARDPRRRNGDRRLRR